MRFHIKNRVSLTTSVPIEFGRGGEGRDGVHPEPGPAVGAEVAKQFLAQVVEQARCKSLTSDEHFTVDGTLLEAWAGAKSFQRKDGKNLPSADDPGNPTVNFHGEKRSNRTQGLNMTLTTAPCCSVSVVLAL